MAPGIVYLPTMALTMVRRVTAKLPFNHFLFRCSPKHTKAEIREYLEKVYDVKVARVTTSITMGKRKRVPGRRLIMRQRDYKRALVQLQDSSTLLPPPKGAAAEKGPELR